MAQDLADMLAIDVERPAFIETTALGAAMLAAVGSGLYASLEDAAVMRGGVTRFAPQMAPYKRDTRLAGWADALSRALQ
jgi:glycerol kinase